MQITCPRCHSDCHRIARTAEMEHLGPFQARAARHCLVCGHTWEPPASTWLLVLGLVAGAILIGFGGLLFCNPQPGEEGDRFRWLGLCGMGFVVITGCWKRLKHTVEAKSACLDSQDFGPTI